MHTESEAREKWCPFARLSYANTPEVGNHAANRWPGDEPCNQVPKGALCIASNCMAWRWAIGAEDDYDTQGKELGFCGLAGKPE